MLRFLRTYWNNRTYTKAIRAEYLRQKRMNCSSVHFYNWWPVEDYTSLWFFRFVQNVGLLRESNKQLNFCSVFGDREMLDYIHDGVRVFFSGENLNNPQWGQYSDYMLTGKCSFDLALGFDELNNGQYMRFPLWLTYMFEPNLDKEKIRERCANLRYPEMTERQKFACLIARTDASGLRTEIYNSMSNIGQIDCPSVLLHNDNSLAESYEDNKVDYMKNYTFNICPENSNASGYCTEKIFESLAAGCIPIYWGCNNMPEQKILNQDAIIFWNTDDNGASALQKIEELLSNSKLFQEFMSQPRLLPGAEDLIIQTLENLQNRLKDLVRNKCHR